MTVFEGLEYSTSRVPAGLPETERRRGEGGWEVKAYLYVPDSLADWEIGYITAELHSGRFLRKDVSVTLVRTAESAGGVVSMGGISLVPDVLIGDVLFSEEDALILPGGDGWLTGSHDELVALLPELASRGCLLAGICAGTVPLARAGLLNARRHTSVSRGFLEAVCPEYSGGALYTDAPAVLDGRVITATGVAPLEFSRELFSAMAVMKPDTLENWYLLHKTGEARFYFGLEKSLKE